VRNPPGRPASQVQSAAWFVVVVNVVKLLLVTGCLLTILL
jgi:hypothetical protein